MIEKILVASGFSLLGIILILYEFNDWARRELKHSENISNTHTKIN